MAMGRLRGRPLPSVPPPQPLLFVLRLLVHTERGGRTDGRTALRGPAPGSDVRPSYNAGDGATRAGVCLQQWRLADASTWYARAG